MPIDQPFGTDCPNGSFCPTGTPSPVQCPKGTYQPHRRKIRVEDCVACDAGKFCDNTGLSAVSGSCQKGFYCIANSTRKNPLDGLTGNICPVGSFCVEGSSVPQICFNGTYVNHTGRNKTAMSFLSNVVQCIKKGCGKHCFAKLRGNLYMVQITVEDGHFHICDERW